MSKKPDLVAYSIKETGRIDPKTKEQIVYWNRLGVAWTNKDGSINVELNSLPIDGKIHIRPPKEKPEEPENDPE